MGQRERDSVGPEVREGFDPEVLKLVRPPLSHEELMPLIVRAQGGDAEAWDLVIRHNLGLVLKNAGQFARFAPVDDLVSAGMETLHRAVTMFEVERGLRFSTFATLLLRQTMHRESAAFHCPVKISDSTMYGAFKRRRKAGSRNDTADRVMRTLRAGRITEAVDQLLVCGDCVDSVEFNETLPLVARLFAMMPPDYQFVLRMRIVRDKPMRLEDIGSLLGGYTKEWVRQTQLKAIAVLQEAMESDDAIGAMSEIIKAHGIERRRYGKRMKEVA